MTDQRGILIQAQTLRPGDKVLLTTSVGDSEEVREMLGVLKGRFPLIEFTLITEINQMFKHEGDLIELSKYDANDSIEWDN